MRNFAARPAAVGQTNCNDVLDMFVNEFFFSFSLLLFTGILFIMGTFFLVDGVQRLFRAWWLDSSTEKKSDVVLLVDVARPIANGVGNSAHNLVKRPIAMTDEKVS